MWVTQLKGGPLLFLEERISMNYFIQLGVYMFSDFLSQIYRQLREKRGEWKDSENLQYYHRTGVNIKSRILHLLKRYL
jgi:hypothetical protein